MNDNSRLKINVLQQRIVWGVFLVFLVSIYFLRTIYIPIFIAYFFAFLLNPLVRVAEKRGFGRMGPILMFLSVVFALLLIFFVIMVPRIVTQVKELFAKLPLLMEYLSHQFGPASEKYLGHDLFSQWKEMVPDILPQITSLPATQLLEGVLSGTAKAVSALLTILMIPILTFYILKDYYILNEKILRLVPRRYLSDVKEVMSRLSIVMGGLIRGQFLVCTILSIYYTISLTALGLDMALLLGIIGGILNLIPFIGPLTFLILSMGMALMGGAQISQCMAIIGVYLAANLVDTTVLTPRIVGKQMGISPMTIILAMLAGGELLGFLGILLAMPIIAIVKVLGGYFTERYLDSAYYQEQGELEGKQSLSDGL